MQQHVQSLKLFLEYKARNQGFQNPARRLVRQFHSHKCRQFELAAQSRVDGCLGAGTQQLLCEFVRCFSE
jgi:hypothetical protein